MKDILGKRTYHIHMPQCELCGSNVDELTKTKVSGAELNVCSECTSLGTTLSSDSESSETTKYSTDSENSGSGESNQNYNQKNSSKSSSTESENTGNPFEDVSDLALEYGNIIETERNRQDLSRQELAKQLGIKESYLRNVENQDTQPNVELQQKIERRLDIDLSQSDDLGH